MKKLLLILSVILAGFSSAYAQLPSGSTCPNWTGTDLNGTTHTLYDYLDQGKTVYIDVSATWCGPCWNYHNTGALENLYTQYGPPGTNEAMVFMIEGDAATNTACLYGPSGCVGGTQGNWVNGTPYPIIDDASIASLLQITYYPTIYMVCPADKKIYLVGQLPTSGLWAKRAQYCVPPQVEVALTASQNVKCYNTNTGSINITPTGASTPYTYHWSNGATTQDLTNIPAGTYDVTVTPASGLPGTLSVQVDGPPSALAVSLLGTTPVGCNGLLGSATIEATGGWSNYTYHWANGQTEAEATNLAAGSHSVSVTDAGNCTVVYTVTLAPAVMPTASVAPPAQFTCANNSFQLNGAASSQGSQYSYFWGTSNGGNITSGETTLTPTINAPGLYTLAVTNTDNNCVSYANVTVIGNTIVPVSNAGPTQALSCSVNSAVLQGSGSTGSAYSYLWTASNGGNIQTGATTLTPTVNAPGTYTLKVTNSTNGCTSTSSTTVSGNSAPPQATITNTGITCSSATTTLNTATAANNPTFLWSGPNNFTSALQNPVVSAAGDYSVIVTDGTTGCSGTTVATVANNTTAPTAAATGGSITCTATSVALGASTNASTALYAWTGPNNFSSAAQNPTVSEAGAYSVVVTNTANGCSSSASTSVVANNSNPTASVATPSTLNCNVSQVQLNAAASSQGANFTYQWTTTNGNIVSGATTLTPLVNQAGSYNLLVSNTENGCTSTTSALLALSPSVAASVSAQTNVSCNGSTNGSATALAAGGNGTFSYSWTNGSTTAVANNLAAGTYLVTVTDGENCTASASVSISEPAVLACNATATAQSANGVNDGTATAAPTGGTAAYSYLWSNSANTATISNLAPGTYSVIVTDANGCTSIQSVTVNSFNCALLASISGTNLTCFGANNGTANVSLVGAANPVTYAWSNGASTQNVSNLAAGTFTVNIVDGNNCPSTLNIAISEPTQVAANATSTNETAAGANDGTATANPTGGAGSYTYAWSNNATTQSINNLAIGTYTVVITDANGCTAQQSVIVSSFACAISATTTSVNVSCFGGANGTATVALVGGSAPFTYAWSNGASAATASNLSAGSYSVVITDANQCPVSATATVTEPLPFTAWTVSTVNPACANEATGSATASIGGGTMPYTFNWNTGATGNILSNVTAGTYTVVVTDANGCQNTTTASIVATDTQAPTIAFQNSTVALNANGTVSLSLNNLNAVVADNCSVASTSISPNVFDCAQVGDHVVTMIVTDAAGLTAVATATVTVVDNLVPSVTCPNSITACAGDNIVTYSAPVAQDNCLLSGGQWQLVSGLPSGSEFPVGATTQTYRFKDASGNVGECSFEVIVTAPVNFTSVVVNNDQNGQSVGSVDISIAGGVAPYTFTWVREGTVVSTSEDLIGANAGTYEVHVQDAAGCKYTQEGIVVGNTSAATEPAWLSHTRFQPNPTSGITNIIFAEVPAQEMEISVIDATGRILVNEITENQQKVTLNCSALPQGIYIVRMRSGAEVGTRRLVISR